MALEQREAVRSRRGAQRPPERIGEFSSRFPVEETAERLDSAGIRRTRQRLGSVPEPAFVAVGKPALD